LACRSGNAGQPSVVDPVAVVDGLDKLIGNPVELAETMQDLLS
jgi:hypothetical protein